MATRQATKTYFDHWVELRHQLWPDASMESLRLEAKSVLAAPEEICFLVFNNADVIIGFAEAAIYRGPSAPYAHLEGWYVLPQWRGRGFGRELLDCVEQWCLHHTIYKLTSDTTTDYPLSPAAHKHLGFKTVCEFTIFMKDLQ